MNYITAIMMGALQGVAEFLPISSSGHLALFQAFFGMEDFESTQLFFSVMLHFGTLISVFVYYGQDIRGMISEFFLGVKDLVNKKTPHPLPESRWLVVLILVATLPLGGVLPVKGYIEAATGDPRFVALMLLVTGCILFLSDRIARGQKDIRKVTWQDALILGIAQAGGTLPGISRSGMTISTGMMRGLDRTVAVRFSFLMSLPAVCGATLLELYDALQEGLNTALLPYCGVGMLVSAVVGYFSIQLVNVLAKKGNFGAFSYYCWAVGGIALIASF